MLKDNPSALRAAQVMSVLSCLHLFSHFYLNLTVGNCIPTESISDFSLDDYSGVWYSLQHDTRFNPDNIGECVTAEYQPRDGIGKGVTLMNR